jgi:hypothetical protein
VNYCESKPCCDPTVKPCPNRKAPGPFKIECVVVCDKYHDFLTHTLPVNKFHFNRMVVVTSAEDKATQKICEVNHVQCVKTDKLRSRWGEFCKGAGINEGMSHLEMDGWTVHMDADIMLPPQTRGLLEKADLDPTMIYGIDRFMIEGYQEFDDFRAEPPLQHENNTYIHTGAFRIGTRVMQDVGNGWVPIGFFQLWHPKGSGVSKYPEGHTNAGREDLLFGEKWPRSYRAMIPEIIGYHLESDESGFGSNWNGRKTPPFRPAPPGTATR